MKYPALVLALILAASVARADAGKYDPIVKVMNSAVSGLNNGEQSTRQETDYCLYFGDEETRMIESTVTQTTMSLSLIHPAPDVVAKLTTKAKKNWYALYFDSVQGISNGAPLLSADMWKTIPAPLQNILVGLGVDDDDLILICYNLYSGSISIYYHPRHDKDKAFYADRLETLKAYLKTNDIEKTIPLDRVVPEETLS